MQRRELLKFAAMLAAGSAAAPMLGSLGMPMPVVDAHIHLFDPSRPGGIPWPEKTDAALYHPALPARYAALAQPHGVVGAIAVECSPWLVDNFWLQDVVERNPIMLGFIGDLSPDAPEFAATLDRLHRSPPVSGHPLWQPVESRPGARRTKAGVPLRVETSGRYRIGVEAANPNPALISAMLQVSDRVPICACHRPSASRRRAGRCACPGRL